MVRLWERSRKAVRCSLLTTPMYSPFQAIAQQPAKYDQIYRAAKTARSDTGKFKKRKSRNI